MKIACEHAKSTAQMARGIDKTGLDLMIDRAMLPPRPLFNLG